MRNTSAAAAGFILGVWLMAAPAVLDYSGLAATIDRIVGPTAAAAAWIAGAEVTRSVRWVNVALGSWTIVSALLLDRSTTEAVHALVTGALLIVTSLLMTGFQQDRFAGGWRSLFDS